MKDSGVEWLGDLPEHWEVTAVKRRYAIRLGKMLQTNPNGPTDIEVPYLKAQHVQWFQVRTADAPRMWASANDSTQFGIARGDLLVCEGGEGGRCGIVKQQVDGYIIQNALHRVRPRRQNRNDYLQYMMSAVAATNWFAALNDKATIAHFTREKFSALRMPIPPVLEQTAIVRFLDHADRRIQRYIRAKQKLVTLLEEQKQALIHRAVTGKVDIRTGLPYPAYKPSAVRWLGNIPEHWEVWQIGYLGRVGNGSTPSRSNMGYWDGGTYPWLNSSSVNHSPIMQADQFVTDLALRECHLPQIQPGSVLVAITGQGKTRGTSAVLDTEATINQHVACVTTRNDVIGAEYLHLALLAAYRELRAISDDSGSTKGALTCWDISHFRVPLPPRAEQAEIVLATRQATKTLESASGKAAQEVMLAREYRIRLIADVVTGKLDVREAAARLPDEVEEPEPCDETDALTEGEEEPSDDDDATSEEAAV